MLYPQKDTKALQSFFIAILYVLAFYCLQFFLCRIQVLPVYPSEINLHKWDVNWYSTIATEGYGANRVKYGFFPLFPLLWHTLHVGLLGMCIANILMFSVGFSILCSLFNISSIQKLIWLSIPSLYFAYIPYSEALFFLLISLSLYGIIKRKTWLIQVSLLFVSLTRATAVFLLPAFLIMELLTNDSIRSAIKNYIVHYALPLIAGLFIFMACQRAETGSWFTYFNLQSQNWGHKYAMVTLPFSTMDGDKRIWLSALGIFIGIIAMMQSLKQMYQRFFRRVIQRDKLLVLSFLYLAAVLFLTTFFNPTWETNTTNLMGMHRYTMATPFFFIFLYHFTNNIEYKLKDFVIIFFISNIAWLLCGSYSHILRMFFYMFNTIFIFIYMALANKKNSWPPMIIFALNVLLQLTLIQQFMMNIYPD